MIPQALAPCNPTMTDPGAPALIGTEHDIIVARALTTTTTAACLATVILRELVTLLLPGGAGTNLDLSLDDHHAFVLEDGRRWAAH